MTRLRECERGKRERTREGEEGVIEGEGEKERERESQREGARKRGKER